jgi:ParD-like antitoxin of type II ParDE toxin-antitoxin system
MATMPTRIDQGLFEAAKAAGELHSRSAAQQLDHWARVGRELEASPAVTHDEIARVLAGQASYDALPDRGQALVRASWSEQVEGRIGALDLTPSLDAAGQPWAEADADGNVVVREPGSAGA